VPQPGRWIGCGVRVSTRAPVPAADCLGHRGVFAPGDRGDAFAVVDLIEIRPGHCSTWSARVPIKLPRPTAGCAWPKTYAACLTVPRQRLRGMLLDLPGLLPENGPMRRWGNQ
jgi:hypothetical protein